MTLNFKFNGQDIEVPTPAADRSLLHLLRSLDFVDSKEGCAEGECGACALAWLDVDFEGNTQWIAVNSCLVPAIAAHGKSIRSASGIQIDEELHPVQEAMKDFGGSQCGFCTPGFVMSMFGEYYRRGDDDFDLEAIGGNLCRCTGYRPIRDAARSLPMVASNDPFAALQTQKPIPTPAFESEKISRPTTLADALSFLADHPETKIIAGGTDAMVEVHQLDRHFESALLLDAIDELKRIEVDDKELRIGALTPLAAIEDFANANDEFEALAELFELFSSRLIRQRATLGGNIGNASPIGDSPPLLIALGASVSLASAKETRTMLLENFYLDYKKTALESDEIITHISIPLPFPSLTRFFKVSKRVLDDISTVAAGFALEVDGNNEIKSIRAAFGGVAAIPKRAIGLEKVLVGQSLDVATMAALGAQAEQEFSPLSDHRGSAPYRRKMVATLLQKLAAEHAEVL